MVAMAPGLEWMHGMQRFKTQLSYTKCIPSLTVVIPSLFLILPCSVGSETEARIFILLDHVSLEVTPDSPDPILQDLPNCFEIHFNHL